MLLLLFQVTFLSELHADKMMALNSQMLQAVYQSIEIGLRNGAADPFSSCCEFVSVSVAYLLFSFSYWETGILILLLSSAWRFTLLVTHNKGFKMQSIVNPF